MGVGEPDSPADPAVVACLAAEAGRRENRSYSDNGILEFQEAAAGYMERVYGVGGLDPVRNIVHGIGSKPILALLPVCFIDPGDIILTSVPGYPIAATYTKYLGGSAHELPLYVSNSFYPDFSKIPSAVLKKAKLLYINYPNNPTGAAATPDFFSAVVRFARKYGIVVIHDAAYGALVYEGERPLSFLEVPGAMDVGVEVHSLSKAFNMTGWRIGFLAGNQKAVAAYAAVKDNTDSGQFRAIQKAAAFALAHTEITAATVAKYSRRFDLLVAALNEIGFAAKKPRGSFYCYVGAPKGAHQEKGPAVTFANAADFAHYLLREALISVVPWDEAGSYVRISVTFEASDEASGLTSGLSGEAAIIEEMKQRMLKLRLRF
jgi:LL-diaminopimelate aminotransferase